MEALWDRLSYVVNYHNDFKSLITTLHFVKENNSEILFLKKNVINNKTKFES